MGDKSRIAWTEATWNPITGCARVSPACDNCYAVGMSKRLDSMGVERYAGVVEGNDWSGLIRMHPEALDQPIRWKRPRMIFPCSMSDIFHHDVPWEFIDRMFEVMTKHAPHHVYTILTKRPQRPALLAHNWSPDWKNLWFGFTGENQKFFDLRWGFARVIPASVLWVSIEPMLGPIELPSDFLERGNRAWVVVGGESGKDARPMHPDWVRSLLRQCQEAGVPFLFKQWGEWIPEQCCDLPVAAIEREEKLETLFGRVPNWLHIGDLKCSWFQVGKKKAGHLLDGEEYLEFPPLPWEREWPE